MHTRTNRNKKTPLPHFSVLKNTEITFEITVLFFRSKCIVWKSIFHRKCIISKVVLNKNALLRFCLVFFLPALELFKNVTVLWQCVISTSPVVSQFKFLYLPSPAIFHSTPRGWRVLQSSHSNQLSASFILHQCRAAGAENQFAGSCFGVFAVSSRQRSDAKTYWRKSSR